MMEDNRLYFYEDDFKEDPRGSEFSEKVVSSWLNKRRRYAVEDIDDPRCLRLVAERLLVRVCQACGGREGIWCGRSIV